MTAVQLRVDQVHPMASPRVLRGLASDDGAGRLRRLREAIGFSQRELAKEFGVAHGAVGLWEAGRRDLPGPVRRLIEIYEQELGITLDDPPGGEDASEPPLRAIPGSVPARALAWSRTAAGAARSAGRVVASGWGGRPAAGKLGERLQEAMADQVVQNLGEMKGLAMKLGQIAGYLDFHAPAAVRDRFATLHTWSRPMSPATVAQVFVEELGRGPGRVFAAWSASPMAAASIGQVHRARLANGQEVAVKVQYPRIVQAVRADLAGAHLLQRAAALIFRGPELGPVVEELRERFLEECDYRLEASHQERFRQLWAGRPGFVIPRIFGDLSTERILVSELVEGEPLESFARRASQVERDRAGERLFDFMYGSMFRHGLFNADPHPGNYLFASDRVAFLDFGCVKRLSPEALHLSRTSARAIFERDVATLRQIGVSAGVIRQPGRFDHLAQHRLNIALYEPFLREGRRRFTREYLARTWRMMWLENPNRFRTNLPRDWVFLLRLQWGLYSILADLGAESDWRARLMDLVYEPGQARPRPYAEEELAFIRYSE
jgi:predicted unusual protein kinase regulating ubiquinone biosynthesis (AarF/ABC1/UbiB family)